MLDIPLDPILNCLENKTYSSNLLYKSGIATQILYPAFESAPWVTINDDHTDKIQKEAETDLIKLVCRYYKVCLIKSLNN
jgi:hypothetical protein